MFFHNCLPNVFGPTHQKQTQRKPVKAFYVQACTLDITLLDWLTCLRGGTEGFPEQSPNGLSHRGCIHCHITALPRSVPLLAQSSPLSSSRHKKLHHGVWEGAGYPRTRSAQFRFQALRRQSSFQGIP